jgi:hypothetical protein
MVLQMSNIFFLISKVYDIKKTFLKLKFFDFNLFFIFTRLT